MTVRTRFAPSPTGYLHIGSARTALFSWLFARQHQGQFILRVEDTDSERSTQESIDAILEAMRWLNLDYDEGPIYQTQRLNRYNAVAESWLADGKAYYCHCSKERLEAVRSEQIAGKRKPKYDGHCRELQLKKAPGAVIRFKTPSEGNVGFNDLIKGPIEFNNNELDDLVLVRSDGMPTYNFAVVVDDADMQITHVLRGDDHVANTPRQIHLFRALNASIPIFGHLPMILGSDGKRLSKRHGAVSVMQYRDAGYLPHALLNYLVRLGWSHGDDEIFSRDAMIQGFNPQNISLSPASFNPEKLLWLNQHYLKSDPPETTAAAFAWHFSNAGIDIHSGPPLAAIVRAQAERCKTLHEMFDRSRAFFEDFSEYDANAQKQLTGCPAELWQALISEFSAVDPWKAETLHTVIMVLAERFQLKLGGIAQPLRAALFGTTVSPSIDISLELMGKVRTLQRLERASKQ